MFCYSYKESNYCNIFLTLGEGAWLQTWGWWAVLSWGRLHICSAFSSALTALLYSYGYPTFAYRSSGYRFGSWGLADPILRYAAVLEQPWG